MAVSELVTAGIVLVGGLLVAWILSIRFHSESRTLESAVRIPLNATWVLIGLFTILGGYYKAGALVFIAGLYFLISNMRRIRNSDVKMNPDGWRQKAGNWTPHNRSE